MSDEAKPTDIRGFEYDWLGCDAVGKVAFFSTAGGGYAPEEFLRDTDLFEAAIDILLACPLTTKARFAPQLSPGYENTWQLLAERGVFAYDSDPHGGPYRLVAAPEVPASLGHLPQGVVAVVRRIHFRDLHLADSPEIASERLARR
ncbi:MAG: hypothetical protein HY901_02115 [Deltaproteobacteria bacterium]|nr:hypothetical protein [Deltaproteobacteria bacterium]